MVRAARRKPAGRSRPGSPLEWTRRRRSATSGRRRGRCGQRGIAPRRQLPGDRFHGVGAATRDDRDGLGMVSRAEYVDDVLHHRHKALRHVVQRTVGEDDRVFEQATGIDVRARQVHDRRLPHIPSARLWGARRLPATRWNVALLMSCPPVAVEARTRRPTQAHRLLRKFDADRWRYDAPPADRALRTRAGDGTPSSGCVRRGGGSRCAPKRARRQLSRWI